MSLNLQPTTAEENEKMEDFFKHSQADEQDDEGKVIVPFNEFVAQAEDLKKDYLFWIGWDDYGCEEIKNTFGKGDINEGVKKLILEGHSVDYQNGDGKTYRVKL